MALNSLYELDKLLVECFSTSGYINYWLNTSHPEFKGRKPQDLIDSGKKDEVINFLKKALNE